MTRNYLLVALLLLLPGCEQKLPGPLACEQMAYHVLGRSRTEAQYSPKVRRIADRLIQGCLTVPFDAAAVTCASSGQPFLSCVDDLSRRSPERKEALSSLLRDLKSLGRI